jgi:NhaP-type Na+/H+ or K+/H+ antiporter
MHFNPIYSLIAAVVAFFVLCLPVIIESRNDRSGESLKEKGFRGFDIYLRIFGFLLFGWLATVIRYFNVHPSDLSISSIASAIFMSFAIHFLTFSYFVTYKLERNGVIKPGSNWFTYEGKTSRSEQIKFWHRIGPNWRFAIRLIVFAIALLIYF